jgi:ABC-type oligopeptide transport system substrate-binding subunit
MPRQPIIAQALVLPAGLALQWHPALPRTLIAQARTLHVPTEIRLIAQWIFMALAMLGLWSAPLADAASPGPQTSQVTLRLAMPQPATLDPALQSRFAPHSRDLVENLFIGLTRFDPRTSQIEPMLATSWNVSADGLTWTFDLREDIHWVRYDAQSMAVQAVRPLTAGDVVYAIQRGCDPRRPEPVTTNLMVVRGCLTVASAFPQVVDDLFIAREIGARATGPHTLEIQLLFPTGYLPSLLSTPEFFPVPREAVTASVDWTRPPALLTSGPYALQSWSAGDMKLTRNPHWPDPVSGTIEEVAVAFTGETLTALDLFANERADFARLAVGQIAEARDRLPDNLHVEQGSTLILLGFSYERLLVNQTEVRRALSAALDRRALAGSILGGLYLPAEQFTPPAIVASPSAAALPNPDPILAQRSFEAAGYPGCAGMSEPVRLRVPDDDPVWLEIGQAIVGQWSATLGCSPSLFSVEGLSRTLLIELAHATYDAEKVTRPHAWMATWSADYPDAHAWLNDALHCRYGYFRTGRECDAADVALDRASGDPDDGARAGAYGEVERLFFGPEGTYPILPLFFLPNAWLQNPGLSGVSRVGAARFDLWELEAGN